jgi:hypothetical protein
VGHGPGDGLRRNQLGPLAGEQPGAIADELVHLPAHAVVDLVVRRLVPVPSVWHGAGMAKRALPNHLWLVLAILFTQIVLNVFGAAVLLYAISGRPGGGLLYFVVWFSLLASAVLAVSALFLVLRNPWARYPVIGIETLAMVSGLVSLVATGTSTGVTNIAFGFVVISVLCRPEVRGWLADVRTPTRWSYE